MPRKKKEPIRNNSEPCTKCKQQDSNCWAKNLCNLIPEFGLDSNGELEHLTCSFLHWLTQAGWPIPVGDELKTVNGYSIIHPDMKYAISICSKEGIPNLVERYRNRLEKLRIDICEI